LPVFVSTWVWLSPREIATLLAPRLGLAGAPLTLDGWTRVFGFLTMTVPLLALLYALSEVFRLCKEFSQGEIITARAALRLRRIGVAMLVIALLRPVTDAILSILLTAGNAPGARYIILGVSTDDYMIAAFGGLILTIGHAMAEAALIADDNRQII